MTIVPSARVGKVSELLRLPPRAAAGGPPQGDQVRLGEERFLATSVSLPTPGGPTLNLWVLKSFDQADRQEQEIDRLILLVSLLAIAAGSISIAADRSSNRRRQNAEKHGECDHRSCLFLHCGNTEYAESGRQNPCRMRMSES